MAGPTRARVLGTLALAAAVVALGLSGCARPSASDSPPEALEAESVAYGWDAQALEAIGFAPADLAAAEPVEVDGSSPSPDTQRRRHRFPRLRFCFAGGDQRCLRHRNVQHGEAVVTTEEGTKTVVVQRGTVTAIDASTITVKSADGFTLTWKFGDPLHVIEHRSQIESSAIAVGTAVGVSGAKDGDAVVARLIVVPRPR